MSQPTSYPDHYRKLITLGVPIIIGQIGMIILGFADTIMIGHHSTEELGAASFVTTCSTSSLSAAPAFPMA